MGTKGWSSKFNGQFSIKWSRSWIPWKGQENNISVDCERYIKHVVIELDGKIEPILFTDKTIGNYCIDTFFGEFQANISLYQEFSQQWNILNYTQIVNPNYNIVEPRNTNLGSETNFLSPHFDNSKSKEGSGVGYILKDPQANKTLIACQLSLNIPIMYSSMKSSSKG